MNKRVESNFLLLFVELFFWAKSEIKFRVVNSHKEMDAFIFFQEHNNYYSVSNFDVYFLQYIGTKSSFCLFERQLVFALPEEKRTSA